MNFTEEQIKSQLNELIDYLEQGMSEEQDPEYQARLRLKEALLEQTDLDATLIDKVCLQLQMEVSERGHQLGVEKDVYSKFAQVLEKSLKGIQDDFPNAGKDDLVSVVSEMSLTLNF